MSMFTLRNYRRSSLTKNNQVMAIRSLFLRAQTFLANDNMLRVDNASNQLHIAAVVVEAEVGASIAFKNT